MVFYVSYSVLSFLLSQCVASDSSFICGFAVEM